ncbi:contractile injection system tape measure protein, partial [Aeromonas jandaei]|uniref:contractile injection system tape measure protein n=1 Tax=Aeromonas jandaei TaxID=650 RepID=UPI003BA39A43
MEIDYRLLRMQIAVSVSGEQADEAIERCSRLFYRELRGVLARVLERVTPAGLSLTLNAPLVLDLGDLPAGTFERPFCRRLEARLEQVLRQRLTALSAQWRWEPRAASWHRLAQWQGAGGETLDRWLERQLTNGPAHWWPALASYLLTAQGMRFGERLRAATRQRVCRQLAAIDLCGGLTKETLWLSALRYFQRHPQQSPPAIPDISGDCVSMVFGPQDLALLQALLAQPGGDASTCSLAPWLSYLWSIPLIREQMAPLLPSSPVKTGTDCAAVKGGIQAMALAQSEEAIGLPITLDAPLSIGQRSTADGRTTRWGEDKKTWREGSRRVPAASEVSGVSTVSGEGQRKEAWLQTSSSASLSVPPPGMALHSMVGGDTPHDVRKGVSRDAPPFLSPPEAIAEVRASRRGLFANEVSGVSTVSGEGQQKEAWLQTSSSASLSVPPPGMALHSMVGGDTPHDVRKGVSRDVPPFLSPPEAIAEVRASRRGLFANEVSGVSTVSGEGQQKEAWLQTSSSASLSVPPPGMALHSMVGGDTPHDVRKGVSRDVPPFLSPPEAIAEVRASRRGLFANEVSGVSTVSGEGQRKEAWLQTSSSASLSVPPPGMALHSM